MNNLTTASKQDSPKSKLKYNSNPFTISFDGFGLFVDYAKGVFITVLLLGLLSFGVNFVGNIATSFIDSSDSSNQTAEIQTESDITTVQSSISVLETSGLFLFFGLLTGVFVVVLAVSLLISAAIKGFIAAGTVSASRKKQITAGQAFSQMGSRLGTLFLAEAVTTARIIGGFILLIIPGVRAQLRYQAVPFIIMKHPEIKTIEAVDMSKRLYKKHLMEVFGIYTVGAIIPFIGQSLSASGVTLSLNQLEDYANANHPTPKTHWINYLGLILVLLFFFFIGLMLALIVLLIDFK
jgi:hypothetical protein